MCTYISGQGFMIDHLLGQGRTSKDTVPDSEYNTNAEETM